MRILKSKYFLSGIGVLLLVGAILGLGAWLNWPSAIQFLAIIGVLVLCILGLAVSMMRASKNSALIEQSLKMQATQQRMNTRPDQKAEFEDLQKQFDAAIERLKQSKLGRGRKGKAALSALPWFVFIGPPGTGKTTAIVNSGLNFPIGTNRIRGVGGTRNCDWFFTDSAILLDTAGRYVTEEEDTEEWNAFLDILKKYRPERPVNGIIVAISAATLAEASYDEIEWHADTIRGRVDELLSKLGVRFPVYLMFTKCDLLDGFVEFFGELPKKEREQIWGCTLDNEQARSIDVRTIFEHEYRRLYDAMMGHRVDRLSRSMKRDERRKVYAFPLQFASIKDKLSLFVGRMFQPNPYQESPIFRGFYFSSGTQEGAPIDHVLRNIAGQFQVPAEADDEDGLELEAKSYFIKDLFTDVVVPDQYMVQATSRAASRTQRLRLAATVGSLVIAALLVLGFSQALFRSKAEIGAVQSAAMMAGPLSFNDPSRLPEDVASLDALRTQVVSLNERRFGGVLQLGLSRTGTVLEPAQALYHDRLRTLIERTAVAALDRRLREGFMASAQMTDQGRDSLYSDLRAYLLLTTERRQLQEEVNQKFLGRYLAAAVGRDLFQRVRATERQAVAQQLDEHVAYYVNAHKDSVLTPFPTNERLVGQVRIRIRSNIPPGGGLGIIYNRIKEEGELALQPFTLSDATGGGFVDLFTQPQPVPGIFTQNGWSAFKEAVTQQTESPERTDWVMGNTAQETAGSIQDPQVAAEQLRQMYFSEYAAAWERFLRGIRVQRFRDLTTASQAMKDLSAYDSPIFHILAAVSVQTTFPEEEGLVDDLSDRAAAVAERRAEAKSRAVLGKEGEIDRPAAAPAALNTVEIRFKRLHDLGITPEAPSPALSRALEGLGAIAGVLEGVQGDPAKAADYAKQVIATSGGELGTTIQSINSAASQLDPDVRKALFTDPALSAWGLIAGAAQQHLNERWVAEVVQPYQQIAGRYPLARDGSQEIPVADFESFFHPQEGPMFAFWAGTLAPFISSDGRPKTWEGGGVRVSPAVLRAYEHARRFGQALYEGGMLRVQFELQPDIPTREATAPAVSQVEIEVHGNRSTYGMGSNRPWTQVSWPGSPGASVRLSTQSGLASQDFPGDWAWFRMLQAAQVQRLSATEYEILWPFPNGISARYKLKTRSSTNPFGGIANFFNFDLPQSLN